MKKVSFFSISNYYLFCFGYFLYFSSFIFQSHKILHEKSLILDILDIFKNVQNRNFKKTLGKKNIFFCYHKFLTYFSFLEHLGHNRFFCIFHIQIFQIPHFWTFFFKCNKKNTNGFLFKMVYNIF